MSVAIVHSERKGQDLLLGAKPPTPYDSDTVTIHMDEVFSTLVKTGVSLPALAAFNNANVLSNGSIVSGGWGMGGNGPVDDGSVPAEYTAAQSGAGDCGIAAPGHEHMMEHKLSGNPGEVTFSCWRDLQNYVDYTNWATPGQAYDPVTGANDDGVDVSQVMKYRQKVGFIDDQGTTHTIGTIVEGTPGDLQQLWLMSMLFQKANFAVTFRSNNMSEFDAVAPGASPTWTYTKNASDEGGHDIFNAGYVLAGGPMGRLISWGDDVLFTRVFYVKQCSEVASYVSDDMYNDITGKDSEGADSQDMELYVTEWAKSFAELNGGTAHGPKHLGFLRRFRHVL
jgi:hypothetical protein